MESAAAGVRIGETPEQPYRHTAHRFCGKPGNEKLCLKHGRTMSEEPKNVDIFRAIYNPIIRSNCDPDLTSAKSIIDSIVTPDLTDEQKAFAIYDLVREYVYHWPAAREGEKTESFEYGVVYDPVKLINVYGYGYCFQNKCVLEALWQLAGLEARGGGISGHAIAEVFYDGQYHYLDADQHGYCLLPDGKTVASMADVENDALNLIVNQPAPSEPFFPASRNPKAPYESKYILAAYFHSKHNNHYQHDKISMGHRMDIILLPGMRYARHFQGDGRFNIHNKSLSLEREVGYVDPSKGPADHQSNKTYGNGELLYQPDLSNKTNEYRRGLWHEENIRQTESGLVPADFSTPARCSFRISLPYVIVGWPSSFTGPTNPTGAAVISLRFNTEASNRSCYLRVWSDVGACGSRVDCSIDSAASVISDLSAYVAGGYEFTVEIEFSGKRTCLEKLSLRTAFQLSPRALPAVRPGKNEMTFLAGPETCTMVFAPRLNTLEALAEETYSMKDTVFEDSAVRSTAGKTAELIYELQPPKPGKVHSFSVDTGCRRSYDGRSPEDRISISWAENSPCEWRPAADDSDFPMYAGHWSYHLNASGECSDNVEKLYIRYQIKTLGNAGIRNILIRLRWKPNSAASIASPGLKISHEWKDEDGNQRFEHVVTEPEYKYTFDAGQEVKNRRVIMEPVRDPTLEWRENDPSVNRPHPIKEKLINIDNQQRMRKLLREIDVDPCNAIPKAAKSGIRWLESGSREVADMLNILLD